MTPCCTGRMHICMRTTVDIDDELLIRARAQAARQGTTLTAVIEAALAAALAPAPQRKKFKLRWKTHKGRLLPGVDVSDRDALFDAMEGRR